ncbi:MAG: winged helix-turn-helix transcriptional regulator [bacterium]|nr:winged helix-turn-helix transcriptional regulator [bacterium]
MLQTSKIFGSVPRTEVLLAISLLGDTYPSELARGLGFPAPSVQRILRDLETEGILVSRERGRTRLYALNPRLYGVSALTEFLRKYVQQTEVDAKLQRLRTRPRRPAKEL